MLPRATQIIKCGSCIKQKNAFSKCTHALRCSCFPSKRQSHNTRISFWRFKLWASIVGSWKNKSIMRLALCGSSFPSSVIGLPDSQLGGRLASTKQTTVTTTSTTESKSSKDTPRWASWTASCSRGRWWRACGSRRRTCPGCSSPAWPRVQRATPYLQVFNSFNNSVVNWRKSTARA